MALEGEGLGWEGRQAALVVHYRCLEETLGCLENLERHAPGLPVVVVENGSADGSRRVLEERLGGDERVRLVFSEANLGFGGGCNLGIEKALDQFPDLDYLLLLNPDCRVEEGFLEELLGTARRRPGAGIVGGLVLSGTGREVIYENGRIRPFTLTRCHVKAPEGVEEYETEFVTGAFMLVAGDLLRRGLRFEERYFLYVEDMDLCLRVKDFGRSLWVNRRAKVRHAGGGSQKEETPILGEMRPTEIYYLARNKVLFARKWLPPLHRTLFLATAVLLKPLAGVLRFGTVRFLPVYFRGLRDGLAGGTR